MFEVELEDNASGKEDAKCETMHCAKRFYGGINDSIESGYKLLSDKNVDKSDQDKIIDIVANLQGSKIELEGMMKKYNDVDKATQDRIDKGTDNFLKGFKGSVLSDMADELPKNSKMSLAKNKGM